MIGSFFMTSMPTGLALIDHIVVLMLENRSFDNMLGWQFGLDPGLFNLTERGERIAVWGNEGIDPSTMTMPDPDPGELFTDMTYQLFERYFVAEGCSRRRCRRWAASSATTSTRPSARPSRTTRGRSCTASTPIRFR